jgi:protein-L-isoaspartate(D-aspartate) O-methyltransferase
VTPSGIAAHIEAKMIDQRQSLDDARTFHARLMAAASGSDDSRLEQVFGSVLRESFMSKGPWQIMVNGRYSQTPDADPRHLYQNALVALDAAKGINNGEPFLHAAWIGAVAPRAGDAVTQIGAGTGYYTALLSKLVEPGGRVQAFEIDPALAEAARENLAAYANVSVTTGDATKLSMPPSDLFYVNAGVAAPPLNWLEAMKAAGRLIFPWRPAAEVGLTLLLVRTGQGFAVTPLMPSLFIPCVGASDTAVCQKVPTMAQARAARSAWLTSKRPPDRTAVAICGPVWFSREGLSAH